MVDGKSFTKNNKLYESGCCVVVVLSVLTMTMTSTMKPNCHHRKPFATARVWVTLFLIFLFLTLTTIAAVDPGSKSVQQKQKHLVPVPYSLFNRIGRHRPSTVSADLHYWQRESSEYDNGNGQQQLPQRRHHDISFVPTTALVLLSSLPRGGGGGFIPGGYNPFGYKITTLGLTFLEFDGSLDSDVGRFLTSIRERKRLVAIKAQWLEIVKAAKTGQAMRIYRTLEDLISFCLSAGLLN